MSAPNDLGTPETHESYGVVTLTRVSCGPPGIRLFASRLPGHHDAIRLQVREAELRHSSGQDRVSPRRQLVEVYLSQAQFAELITTLNIGEGVPCTITRVAGQGRAEVPKTPTEVERVSQRIRSDVLGLVGLVEEQAQHVRDNVTPLPDKKRRVIEAAFDAVKREVQSNIPYLLQVLEEATGRVTTAAKADIEATVARVVNTLGAEALEARRQLAENPKK